MQRARSSASNGTNNRLKAGARTSMLLAPASFAQLVASPVDERAGTLYTS